MRTLRALVSLGLLLGVALGLAGCELVADFDRSKIPRMAADSGPDMNMDADVTPPDAGPDSGQDADAEPEPEPEDDAGREDDAG